MKKLFLIGLIGSALVCNMQSNLVATSSDSSFQTVQRSLNDLAVASADEQLDDYLYALDRIFETLQMSILDVEDAHEMHRILVGLCPHDWSSQRETIGLLRIIVQCAVENRGDDDLYDTLKRLIEKFSLCLTRLLDENRILSDHDSVVSFDTMTEWRRDELCTILSHVHTLVRTELIKEYAHQNRPCCRRASCRVLQAPHVSKSLSKLPVLGFIILVTVFAAYDSIKTTFMSEGDSCITWIIVGFALVWYFVIVYVKDEFTMICGKQKRLSVINWYQKKINRFANSVVDIPLLHSERSCISIDSDSSYSSS